MDDDEDEFEDGQDVPDEVHTVCHLCGGGGLIADPKFAVVGGVAKTLDNGRPCLHCDTEGRFPGIVLPL
ncbi:hypothetical protein [Actinokineospora diospyrosa]|uniref:hypothetical protein n=1 Tax=Actinokineospora diospyrosa TaxID=103728 RepID=UPI0020A43ADE|nr:hypothetical protein [Actinokineospora diospyrosa]